MKIFFKLFTIFFRIGAFTFGGGIAMLPMLKKELIENNEWITEDELMNYYSIGQCTPGIIAVNTATFVGFKVKGKIGAIFSTLGVILPSFIIILLIASFIKNFLHLQWVIYIFSGVKIAVCALVLDAGIYLFKRNVKGKFSIILFFVAFILNFVLKISPLYIIFSCIVFGVFLAKYNKNK